LSQVWHKPLVLCKKHMFLITLLYHRCASMMCRGPVFLACLGAMALLPNSALAARMLHQGQQSQAKAAQLLRGDVVVAQKCIFNEPMPLDCNVGATVKIVSAFWRRQEQAACVKPEHVPKDQGKRCHANATDHVIKQCAGQQKCILPSGFTGCPENPFTFLRIRFKCQPEGTNPETVGEGINPDSPIAALSDKELHNLKITSVGPARETVSLVTPTRLNNDHCNLLQIGSWGCEAKENVDSQMSSPLLPGDNVCQCRFVAFDPMTCDKLFPWDDKVISFKRELHEPAVFGKEGCSCYKTEKMLSICDLAVRAEQV